MRTCHVCNGTGELPETLDWRAMLCCTCVPGTGAGHAVYDWRFQRVRNELHFDSPSMWPLCGASDDYRIARAQGQPQGYARLTHHRDFHGQLWTAICCWDSTGDSRMRSNTTFAALGVWPAAEVLEAAAKAFPTVIARLKQARPDTDFGVDVQEVNR